MKQKFSTYGPKYFTRKKILFHTEENNVSSAGNKTFVGKRHKNNTGSPKKAGTILYNILLK
ncbi:hypothetical protein [uncultured Parabacteroides sp.]|uniref:hypothetical protein n=1 Tax=uncultured Parabacteroides sp. TaxID=512312 RepID=UPI002596428A|nr:hypothetical protein [uncultured Parabacteroides sp.]